MKKASIVVSKDYSSNKLFDLSDPRLNRDNCLRPFVLLKDEFAKRGFDLSTNDINSESESDIVIYNEMPKGSFPSNREKSFLLIFESEIIRPDNWNKEAHKYFRKIFTWNDKYVDNSIYYKMNFPNNIEFTEVEEKKRPHLVTLIAGNKSAYHPLELYSERKKTIEWFEKFHPNDFDFYGIGWTVRDFGPSFIGKVLKKLKMGKIIKPKNYTCYKGAVSNKFQTLREYQFSICYENGRDITGYITEKVFDCLFAGTIPVYWGPQNIGDHVPSNCYIDRTNYKTHEELFKYLKNMSLEEIQNYQRSIVEFLKSDRVNEFSSEHFAENIAQRIFDE